MLVLISKCQTGTKQKGEGEEGGGLLAKAGEGGGLLALEEAEGLAEEGELALLQTFHAQQISIQKQNLKFPAHLLQKAFQDPHWD